MLRQNSLPVISGQVSRAVTIRHLGSANEFTGRNAMSERIIALVDWLVDNRDEIVTVGAIVAWTALIGLLVS